MSQEAKGRAGALLHTCKWPKPCAGKSVCFSEEKILGSGNKKAPVDDGKNFQNSPARYSVKTPFRGRFLFVLGWGFVDHEFSFQKIKMRKAQRAWGIAQGNPCAALQAPRALLKIKPSRYSSS